MDGASALVRVVGYHVSGQRVHPFDKNFGTRIFIVPRPYCDVVFPPALNDFALTITYAYPDFHTVIRQSANGNLNFFRK